MFRAVVSVSNWLKMILQSSRRATASCSTLAGRRTRSRAGRIWEVHRVAGRGLQVELAFESGAIDLAAIPAGTPVWKTDDPAMRKRLEQTYVGDPIARRERIWMSVEGEIGGQLRLSVRDAFGHESRAEWSGPLEEARKHATSPDDLREQLVRLGDTPFALADVEIHLPATAMIPRSVLNDLRRRAVADLLALREAASRVVVADASALDHSRRDQY